MAGLPHDQTEEKTQGRCQPGRLQRRSRRGSPFGQADQTPIETAKAQLTQSRIRQEI